jgi:hypothetical protein
MDARHCAALTLAEQGRHVFLLGRSKRPMANCPPCRTDDPDHDRETCDCLTCHGFYAATTDPCRITAMLAAHPAGLLAIRTRTVSRLLVVDIDPRNGGHLDPTQMTPTATVATGGGGWHLHYHHPSGPTAAKLTGHPGVDLKGDGGYVVAPPSIHPGTGRPYRWVGDWPVNEMPPPLIALCRPAPESAATPPTRATPTLAGGGGISSPVALLAAHLDAVARAPEGRRRTTLYGAARGVARMVAAGALNPRDARDALTDAGRAAGQNDRDIRAAIRGGFSAESVATEGTAA